jgi:hypothetical protein
MIKKNFELHIDGGKIAESAMTPGGKILKRDTRENTLNRNNAGHHDLIS